MRRRSPDRKKTQRGRFLSDVESLIHSFVKEGLSAEAIAQRMYLSVAEVYRTIRVIRQKTDKPNGFRERAVG